MSRLRRTTALVALLAYFALSTFGAGWVVCTGANGHVAFESLTAGCCTGGDDAPVAHAAAIDCCGSDAALQRSPSDHDDLHDHIGCDTCDGNDDCGDCDDIALSDLTQARGPPRDDVPSLPDVLPLPGSLPASLTAFVVTAVARRGIAPRPPPELRNLSCTILRL